MRIEHGTRLRSGVPLGCGDMLRWALLAGLGAAGCTEAGRSFAHWLSADAGLGTEWTMPMDCAWGTDLAFNLAAIGLDTHDVFYDYPGAVTDSSALSRAWSRTRLCLGAEPGGLLDEWTAATVTAVVLDSTVEKTIYSWFADDRDALFADLRDSIASDLGTPTRLDDRRLRWVVDTLIIDLSPYARLPGGAPQLTISTPRVCRWFATFLVAGAQLTADHCP